MDGSIAMINGSIDIYRYPANTMVYTDKLKSFDLYLIYNNLVCPWRILQQHKVKYMRSSNDYQGVKLNHLFVMFGLPALERVCGRLVEADCDCISRRRLRVRVTGGDFWVLSFSWKEQEWVWSPTKEWGSGETPTNTFAIMTCSWIAGSSAAVWEAWSEAKLGVMLGGRSGFAVDLEALLPFPIGVGIWWA